MDLRQLRYFVAVAEERNFTRAAARLHVSQPPLSTQIRALERELGTLLLTRDNRGASLTPAGEVLLAEARSVLERLRRAAAAVRDAGRGETGTLALGFVSIVDYGALPAALKAYRSRHPGVEVQLRELTTDEQCAALLNGTIDLGIALAPVAVRELMFRPLVRESLVAALPATHPLARMKGPLAVADLRDEDFIVAPRELAPGLYDAITDACRRAGFAPRVAQQARQMQTVVSLVAGEMGVSLVPESLRQLARKGVVYKALKGRQARLGLGALQRANDPNPRVAHFIQVLRDAASRG